MVRTRFQNSTKTRPIWTQIKIGRKKYEIKKGDYIMDNGSCLQLFAGDRHTMQLIGKWGLAHYIRLEKSIPPLEKLECIQKEFCKYYFL